MLTVDQVIGLAACLAAFVAALATFMTVREMAKQRRAAFMPELIINERAASLQARYDTQRKLFELNKTFQLTADQPESDYRQSIKIVNVGLGSAKKINARWTIDTEKMVKVINGIAAAHSINVRFKYDARLRCLWIEGKEINSILHMVENQVCQQTTHLLPASFDQEGIKLIIPPFFIESNLFCMTAAFKGGANGPGFKSLPILPAADLALEYLDIQDNRYKKRFRLKLDMLLVKKTPATEKDQFEIYDFEVGFNIAENR